MLCLALFRPLAEWILSIFFEQYIYYVLRMRVSPWKRAWSIRFFRHRSNAMKFIPRKCPMSAPTPDTLLLCCDSKAPHIYLNTAYLLHLYSTIHSQSQSRPTMLPRHCILRAPRHPLSACPRSESRETGTEYPNRETISPGRETA